MTANRFCSHSSSPMTSSYTLLTRQRADDYISKHIGTLLTPPLEPGAERLEQLGEFESHVIQIEGEGWKQAAADITLRGLGWVAVTGAGTAQVKISVPNGIGDISKASLDAVRYLGSSSEVHRRQSCSQIEQNKDWKAAERCRTTIVR